MIYRLVISLLIFFTLSPISANYRFFYSEINTNATDNKNEEWTAFHKQVNFGIGRKKHVLFKIDFDTNTTNNLTLELKSIYANIKAFVVYNDDTTVIQNSSTIYDFPSFKIPNKCSSFYLEAKLTGVFYVPIIIESKKAFSNKKFYNKVFFGVFIGSLTMFFLLSIIFYLLFKQKLYGVYALYIVSAFMLFICISGMIQMFFDLDKESLVRSIFIVFIFYYTMVLVLSKKILDMKRIFWAPIDLFIIVIGLCNIVLVFLPIEIGVYFHNFSPVLLMLSLTYLSIKRYLNQKRKSLLFYSIGWVSYYLGAITMILLNIGIINANIFSENASYIGALIECSFFIMAAFYNVKEESNRSNSTVNLSLYSQREKEVIDLLIQGKTNQQIADELFISLSTIKFHLGNIYKKAEVKNKSEALSHFLGRN